MTATNSSSGMFRSAVSVDSVLEEVLQVVFVRTRLAPRGHAVPVAEEIDVLLVRVAAVDGPLVVVQRDVSPSYWVPAYERSVPRRG
jgi:hypothetical protein